MTGKEFLSPLIFLLLMSTTLSVNTVWVSAVPLSPYIMVVPEKTLDPTITPGMNYPISVYTNYSGNDIWAWEFSLTFDPSVLQMGINTTDTWIGDNVTVTFTATRAAVVPDSEKIYVNQVLMTKDVNYTMVYETGEIAFTIAPSLGAEVKAEYIWTGLVNGDLIATAKDPSAAFLPGTFNNTEGKLSKTDAYFYYVYPATPPTTSGPGTLAYITFRVVGYGSSDIILGQDTKLVAPGPPPYYVPSYVIIDAKQPPSRTSPPYGSDHIGNGHFENIHDVAITDLIAPTTAILGDTIAINVTAANRGNATASFNITVYANTTLVGNQTVSNLAGGDIATLAFNWNTTTMTAGNYIVNATAWLPPDDDPKDNTKTATIKIKTLHDVAVISLEIPAEANAGDLVTIKVTVANQGTFEENVNLTIYYRPEIQYPPPPTVMNTTTFTLGKRPTSITIQTNWNTTGLDNGSYNINATITIDKDEDPSDNTLPKPMDLNLGHDVSITGVSATPKVFVGETVAISVTIQNVGGINETLVEVKVTCGTETIGSQQVPSLTVGNSATLSFPWSTAGLNPQIYLIEAKAILDKDVDQTNNRKTTTVVVAAPLPTTGHIIGTVTDASTGNPIEGAQVTAGGKSVSTNATGDYSIELAAGTYNVTVYADGYESSSETDVNVVAGATTTVDFMLKPNQPSNILLYAAAIIVIIVVIAGTALYLRKRKKTT